MGSRRATAKRVFGEISQLPSRRFRARYTGPDRNRHSAPVTFVARIDAEGWLVEQERLISRGEWGHWLDKFGRHLFSWVSTQTW